MRRVYHRSGVLITAVLLCHALAHADVVSTLLPWANPIPGDPGVRASDINANGWVLGGTQNSFEPFVVVWVPNGQPTIVPSYHYGSSLAMGGTHAVDLNNAGDVLVQFVNDIPAQAGKDYQIFHPLTNTVSDAFFVSDIPTLWGPISTQSDNGNGMHFENFGPDSGHYPETGARLVTEATVPEPGTMALLGTALFGFGFAIRMKGKCK